MEASERRQEFQFTANVYLTEEQKKVVWDAFITTMTALEVVDGDGVNQSYLNTMMMIDAMVMQLNAHRIILTRLLADRNGILPYEVQK